MSDDPEPNNDSQPNGVDLDVRVATVQADTQENVAPTSQTESSTEFRLQRLKFVLGQIEQLNERLYRHIALYQTLTVAIVTAIATVFAGWKKLGLQTESVKTTIQALLGLEVFVSVFVVMLIVIGVISWHDYRREEVKLFDEVVGKGYREPPAALNLWRWHETYLVLFIVVVAISVTVFVNWTVIPQVK